jgi:O-methyltransferase
MSRLADTGKRLLGRAEAVQWRPPGYGRARQRAIDLRFGVEGLRRFLRDLDASPAFQESLDTLRSHGVYYEPKLLRYWQLYQLAEAVVTPGAEVAEFGVYQGATARILADVMARRSPDAELHLFDTFVGMPSEEGYDYSGEEYRPGDLGDVDVRAVRAVVERDGVHPVFHIGTFKDTLPEAEATGRLSLSHIDADLYESVLEACEWCYPRTIAGGAIVFDDYAAEDCPGADRAIAEFFNPRRESPVVLPTGQAVVFKQASSEDGT